MLELDPVNTSPFPAGAVLGFINRRLWKGTARHGTEKGFSPLVLMGSCQQGGGNSLALALQQVSPLPSSRCFQVSQWWLWLSQLHPARSCGWRPSHWLQCATPQWAVSHGSALAQGTPVNFTIPRATAAPSMRRSRPQPLGEEGLPSLFLLCFGVLAHYT